ncbi:MAG: HAMP domain-containing protein [Lachnospiraceae bacterium]|nr:HAMP domain-containing protein [Lachnospiraceae bacterium]
MGTEKVRVPFFHSIRFRLIISFFVPIACVVALGIISYNRASVAITEEYKNQTLQTADVLNEYVTLIIDSEKEEFRAYLIDQDLGFFFKGSLDKEKSGALKRTYGDNLLSKTTVDTKVKDIYFIGEEGRSIMARSIPVSDNAYRIFSDSIEGQAIAADSGSWHLFGRNDELDTEMGLHVGEYALRYVRKLGNLNAVIIADFDAETIRDALSILEAGENGYVAIVTTDGKEFHGNSDMDNRGIISGQSFYADAIASEKESDAYMVMMNGKRFLFAFSKINESGDMVAALIPQTDIVARTNNIKIFTMVLTIVAAAVSLTLATLISAKMTGTIHYILRKLKKVADGDLTTELHAKGKDELAQLCGGINHTVGNVKKLITKVNEIGGEVDSSAKEMETASETFKETSGDIRRAVTRIEEGTDKLDNNSTNCLRQMDNLSGKITEVTGNTDEISRFTARTGETIEEGIASVKELTESAEVTGEITDEVISTIKQLEEKLKAVHDVVNTINDIAKRTNLLSLNASIEAARAGEAGRGFTVVAEEIRNLSTQCMESAGRISEIVNDVSLQTEDVVKTAGKAGEAVASQSEVVEKTKESFNIINSQVTGLIESLDTIFENVSQMDKSRAETLSSIEGISEISTETVSCAGEVNDAAEKQVSAIGNLDEASNKLKTKSEELIRILGSFTV